MSSVPQLRRLVCRLHKCPLYGSHSRCPSTAGKLSYYCQTCGFICWASEIEGSAVVDDLPAEDEVPTFGYATEAEVMTSAMLSASKQGRLALIQLNAKHNSSSGDAEDAEKLRLEGQLLEMRQEIEKLRDEFRRATRAVPAEPEVPLSKDDHGHQPDDSSQLLAASAAGPLDVEHD